MSLFCSLETLLLNFDYSRMGYDISNIEVIN